MSSYTAEEETVAEDITMLSTATILLSFRQPSPPAVRVSIHPQEPFSSPLSIDEVGVVLHSSRVVALRPRQRMPACKVQRPSRKSNLTARMHAQRRSTAYMAKYHGNENRLLVQALERSGWTRPRAPLAFVPGVDDQMDIEDEGTVYDEATDDDESNDPDATESESDTTAPPSMHGIPLPEIDQVLEMSRANQLRAAQNARGTCRASGRGIDSPLKHADVLPVSPYHKSTAVRGVRALPSNLDYSCSADPPNSHHIVFRPVGMLGTQEQGKRTEPLPVARPAKRVSWSDAESFENFPLALPSSRSVADITPAGSQKTSRQASKVGQEKAEDERVERDVVTRVGRRTKKPRRM